MLKKLALPVVALAVVLILASAPAKAAVRFGVTVGPPVYTYPAYPYYYNPYYYDPYAYPNVAPDYYYAPAYPYFGFGYYGRGWGHGHERFEHGFHGNEGRGFVGHGFGGGGFRGGGHGGGGHRR